jgi:hypothetical protein
MNQTEVASYISGAFAGVDTADIPGMSFFFTDPERKFPFATIISKDNEYDSFSRLDRGGVFRLNIGVSKETFRNVVGETLDHDFTAIDKLMPHPIYGAQHWLCVLNPSEAAFETIKPLLAEAYDISVKRYGRKQHARF